MNIIFVTGKTYDEECMLSQNILIPTPHIKENNAPILEGSSITQNSVRIK